MLIYILLIFYSHDIFKDFSEFISDSENSKISLKKLENSFLKCIIELSQRNKILKDTLNQLKKEKQLLAENLNSISIVCSHEQKKLEQKSKIVFSKL